MAEAKKTNTRVTAAQVNKKVEALSQAVEDLTNNSELIADRVEELANGVGLLVEKFAQERAAQLIAESRTQVQEAPPKRKTPVGERDGDVIVRNMHTKALRVRIGKDTDPYRINLEPRGQKGDTMAVPASLRNDLNYKNNLGIAFEEITQEKADKLRGQRRARRVDPETEKARQRVVTQDVDSVVSRKVDVTPEDRLSRVGPRYMDVPGSNNPSTYVNEDELGWADAEGDPEYRQFLKFKAAQRAARQAGQDFPEAPIRGRDQVEKALHSDDPEARAMAAYIRKMEGGGRAGPSETGVIPKGELSKPVRVEHATISVQPHRPA